MSRYGRNYHQSSQQEFSYLVHNTCTAPRIHYFMVYEGKPSLFCERVDMHYLLKSVGYLEGLVLMFSSKFIVHVK